MDKEKLKQIKKQRNEEMVKGIEHEKLRKKIKRANKSVLLMHLKAYKGNVDSKWSEQGMLVERQQ